VLRWLATSRDLLLEYVDHTNGAALRSANNAGRQGVATRLYFKRLENTIVKSERGALPLDFCCRTAGDLMALLKPARVVAPADDRRHQDRGIAAFTRATMATGNTAHFAGSLSAGGQSLDGVADA